MICIKCGQDKKISAFRKNKRPCRKCLYKADTRVRSKGVKEKNRILNQEMIALRPRLSYGQLALKYKLDPRNIQRRIKNYERKNSNE